MVESEMQAEVDKLLLIAGVTGRWKLTVDRKAEIGGYSRPWPWREIHISGAVAALRPDLMRAWLAREVGHARQPRTAILTIFVCAGLLAMVDASLSGMSPYVAVVIFIVTAGAMLLYYVWWERDADEWAATVVGKESLLELCEKAGGWRRWLVARLLTR